MSRTSRIADLHTFDLSGAAWRKSSYSNGGEHCVEVTDLPGGLAVRDSKDPEREPLRYHAAQWRAFCASVIDGEL